MHGTDNPAYLQQGLLGHCIICDKQQQWIALYSAGAPSQRMLQCGHHLHAGRVNFLIVEACTQELTQSTDRGAQIFSCEVCDAANMRDGNLYHTFCSMQKYCELQIVKVVAGSTYMQQQLTARYAWSDYGQGLKNQLRTHFLSACKLGL